MVYVSDQINPKRISDLFLGSIKNCEEFDMYLLTKLLSSIASNETILLIDISSKELVLK